MDGMSEFLNHSTERATALAAYCRRLIAGENGRMLYDEYRELIDRVTAEEAMIVLDELLLSDIPFDRVKENVGKIMNVFYLSLHSFRHEDPGEGHFLHLLMRENREMEIRMQALKDLLKSLGNAPGEEKRELLNQIGKKVGDLKPYELHYIKKENILFPHIERTFPSFRCLQLMWSFHDDFRKSIKELIRILDQEVVDESLLSREMGKLFFVVLPIIFREEKVVFPVAMKYIAGEVWHDMLQQSAETGWCYIDDPMTEVPVSAPAVHSGVKGLVDLGTGLLSAGQITLMLEHLPVDITYIDEFDEVRYFSGARHRIFPRAKSIIGRKVQNCHPPSSVHIVNEIVDAFRSGERDVAEFWIQMRGSFIHIRYYALRDESKQYRGTIEVSQDVTGIRQLTGEQRLLEWE